MQHLTVFVVFNRASIAVAATVSARGLFLSFLGGDLRRTCWATIRPQHLNPFALMAAGIESLVAAFALHATKKHVAFSAQSLNLYSFIFEDMLKCWLLKI
jgi:hypothetical protein